MTSVIKPKVWDPSREQSPINWAQHKLDGHWLRVEKKLSGECYAYTSIGTDITNKLKETRWWGRVVTEVPVLTTMDGELYLEGEPASQVKSALKDRPQDLRFGIFSVPVLANLPIGEWSLPEVQNLCTIWGLEFVPFESYDSQVDYAKRAIEENLEGWVLKRSNSEGWYKIKPVRTIDAFVTGFKDGKGKFLGLIGALEVSVVCKGPNRWVTIASVGGMNDVTRVAIDEIKDHNRVLEISYQYVGSKGRLRHPRFKRWRDDKLLNECFTDQDPQLEKYWREDKKKV